MQKYDLEERTINFAKRVRILVKKIPKKIGNNEDASQLIRSSGSIGANYIEANEALSRKDFFHKIKICLKETKESRYWLILIDINNEKDIEKERKSLIDEATELLKIFSKIING